MEVSLPSEGQGREPHTTHSISFKPAGFGDPQRFPRGSPCRPGLSEGPGQATAGECESLVVSQSRATPAWMTQDLMF